MTEASHNALNEVLERLDALSESRGSTRDDVLDPGELSAATGLGTREIRTLLRGGRVREREVGETAPRRVNFLYERCLRESGRRSADIVGEVAARLGVTGAWARSLLQGGKCPNVPHLAALADYFGVPLTFFTDSPCDALVRELRPVVGRLESEPAGGVLDPLAALVGEHGTRAIAARDGGRTLTRTQREAIARFVVDFVTDSETGR
ncbi:helix-turn-helix transcriptional regulator [Streptomyces sp. CNQ085]|uniref:helix-turn-helix domain-containing protein n=1 Tax=Streptomyces sp. CNQ085 TaxID=2886944 RepID=UPI001F50DB02|nr:helix-turn-helix transcriptional regulator [Streptomyces sp. CNQ085]MCI0383128.1 helix-turn-helix transcriptional regulator [Streptomyces sp. CNQ085]